MATAIRSLAAQLSLQADNFNNALRQSARELKAFESNFKPSLALAKDLGTAMAAAGTAVAGSMLAATKIAVDFGDKLNDLRQKTGASVETLSMLGFAAEQSGSSMEGLATGLKFLAKNMEAAKDGGKAQLEAFSALGVSSQQLAAAHGDVNKVMLLVADSFAAMEDGSEKTALALNIFGKSGADLIPMLNEGSAGLRKLGADAVKAGFVMSNDMAAASDKLNDTLNELKGAALGVSVQIANALVPDLQKAAEVARDATQELGLLVKNHKLLTEAILIGAGVVSGAALSILGIGAAAPSAVRGYGFLTAAVTAALGPLSIFKGIAAAEIPTALALLGGTAVTASVGLTALAAGVGASIGIMIGSLANWVIEITGAQKALDSFTDGALKLLGFQWGAISEAQRDAAFTADAVAKAQAKIGPAIAAWQGPIITAAQLTANYQKSVADAESAQKKFTEELKRAQEVWKDEKVKVEEAAIALAAHNAILQVSAINAAKLAGSSNLLSVSLQAQADASVDLDLAAITAINSTNLLTDSQRAAIAILLQRNAVDADAIKLHEDETKRIDALTKAAQENERAMRQATDDVKRSAGHIFDDMFLKGQNVFTSLRNALKGGALSLGRAIFEDISGALLGPVKAAFDSFFKGIIEGSGLKKLGEKLGSTISDALTGGRSGGFVGPIQQATGGGSGGTGGAIAKAGGAMGMVNMITGGISAVSGIIGNFQMARLEGTMNAVEANTRFTYIEIKDMMDVHLSQIVFTLGAIHSVLSRPNVPATGLAKQQAATAAAPSVSITVEVHNTFRIAGGAEITTAVVRDRIMPEIDAALETGIRGYREKWTRYINPDNLGNVSSAT